MPDNIVKLPNNVDLYRVAQRVIEDRELDGVLILGLKGDKVLYARANINRLELIGLLEDYKSALVAEGNHMWETT
jgi:hypothetical protein